MKRAVQKRLSVRRAARRGRVRRRVVGDSTRPRLLIHRSNKHIYAQVLDPINANVLATASTVEKDLANGLASTSNAEAAVAVGKAIGERAVAKGVTEVVFDRKEYLYHGRVKAMADAAREAGLKF